MWEHRHKVGVNHQTGTEAKTARRKLGPGPRLRALGSLQLDGATRAGPDVGWGKSQSCWRLLGCRERDKVQTDGTVRG